MQRVGEKGDETPSSGKDADSLGREADPGGVDMRTRKRLPEQLLVITVVRLHRYSQ